MNDKNIDGTRDPRVRSFVFLVRIVWQTAGEQKDDGWPMRCETQGAELLLAPKRGQVCERPFGSSSAKLSCMRFRRCGRCCRYCGNRRQGGGITIVARPRQTAKLKTTIALENTASCLQRFGHSR